jgi:hypothetical protein
MVEMLKWSYSSTIFQRSEYNGDQQLENFEVEEKNMRTIFIKEKETVFFHSW